MSNTPTPQLPPLPPGFRVIPDNYWTSGAILPHDTLCFHNLAPETGWSASMHRGKVVTAPDNRNPHLTYATAEPLRIFWHNPQNLSDEVIGVPEWRLLCADEKCAEGDQMFAPVFRDWVTPALSEYPDLCGFRRRITPSRPSDCPIETQAPEEIIMGKGSVIPSPMSHQVGGDHYKSLAIQPAEYTTRNGIGHLAGDAIAYITRYKDKHGKEDLEKAIHSIQMLIAIEYGK